jgi:hypothetical protein
VISIEVQFEHRGDLYTYSAPEIVDHGDRVIVPRDGSLAVGVVVAIGSPHTATEEIIRVIRPDETVEEDSDAGDAG